MMEISVRAALSLTINPLPCTACEGSVTSASLSALALAPRIIATPADLLEPGCLESYPAMIAVQRLTPYSNSKMWYCRNWSAFHCRPWRHRTSASIRCAISCSRPCDFSDSTLYVAKRQGKRAHCPGMFQQEANADRWNAMCTKYGTSKPRGASFASLVALKALKGFIRALKGFM